MPRWICLVMLCWPLFACSPTTVLNALAPSSGIAVTRDIAYATGARHALDIYAPAITNAPVVVFLYGGGWRDGDRSGYSFVGATLAARGFVVVVPDYRVYPEVLFPAFVEDGAQAVAWTKAHIQAFGGDPARIHLMGHSAGAHIAALLILDGRYLAQQGLDPDRDIVSMVGLAGPYDFLPLTDPVYQRIFAPAGDLAVTQPITFARVGAPPVLLLTGRDDTTVLPRNSENLAARITALGGRAEARAYPAIGHLLVLGAIAGALSWTAPVLDDCVAFLRKNGSGT